jgi:quercetin dioxygenase-like cupin family protein
MVPKLEWIQLEEAPWESFGGQTREIFRKSLSAKAFPSGFRASLTLAKRGGEFLDHVDPYTHIFYILEGEGEASVEGQMIALRKGVALTVDAGKRHGYRNSGKTDLLLITLNIFERGVEQ